ncbi:MAG: polysaccharide deacetylase [Sulfobacillus acidophilus]|uniref:Polysaccharide deacetylase n=1 Tax=Sulfobacillus acidophilus TaxID=53633 RepID=A0A2T2WNF7_9FIRM|nr:MAG: polysaccharide deacetylase [Sulfobacillus acidophilus]
MRLYVISLRGPVVRLCALVVLLMGGVSFVNPRLLRASPTNLPIPVYRVETAHHAMALTINVVWGTEYVPKMLEELRSAQVRATFMVGGAWAKANPELVREMVADKDEVGNHGYRHRHPNQLSLAENIADITRTNQVIKTVAGVQPTLYAPPYGEFNRTVLEASQLAHMTLVMWTIDTIDWRESSSVHYMTTKVLTRAAPGALVLMHPTARTVAALPQIIQGLKHRNFQLVTVSRLLLWGHARTDS